MLLSLVSRFAGARSGATSIEYGLMLGMMALVCITSFNAVGGVSGDVWGDAAVKVGAAMK